MRRRLLAVSLLMISVTIFNCPSSSLEVGEAYCLFADGRMGRGRIFYSDPTPILSDLHRELIQGLQARIVLRSAEEAAAEIIAAETAPAAMVPATATTSE